MSENLAIARKDPINYFLRYILSNLEIYEQRNALSHLNLHLNTNFESCEHGIAGNELKTLECYRSNSSFSVFPGNSVIIESLHKMTKGSV